MKILRFSIATNSLLCYNKSIVMGYYGAINLKGRVIMSYNVKSVDSLRKAVCQSLSENGFTFSISEGNRVSICTETERASLKDFQLGNSNTEYSFMLVLQVKKRGKFTPVNIKTISGLVCDIPRDMFMLADMLYKTARGLSDNNRQLEIATSKAIDGSMSLSDAIDTLGRVHFGVPTLKMRNSDELDFIEVSVGSIASALEAAYKMGAETKGSLLKGSKCPSNNK